VRVVLFTGKGGVGKTTMAAATAARIAADGGKTLVLSADPAHSLADALAVPMSRGLRGGPVEIAPGLFVEHIDAHRRLHEVWGELQGYLVAALGAAGLDNIRAEELTVLPGAEELLALLEVREQAMSGRWDAVVVDCAPTAETLRLLALPEALEWYLGRALPSELKVVRALRPLLGPAVGLPTPRPEVWEAAEQLQTMVADVQRLLRHADTSVRLVLTPESVVVAEARRSLTQLVLYGNRVDAVIANRVFRPSSDPWRSRWTQAQQAVLDDVATSFEPLPILTADYQAGEPVGVEALSELGLQVYGDGDPLAGAEAGELMHVWRDGRDYVMGLRLPLVERESLDLTRVGDELVVSVDGRRRLFALPSVFRRCVVSGARVDDGQVQIRFAPDPSYFPRLVGDFPQTEPRA
jgi:arsenite-transporting ATPase